MILVDTNVPLRVGQPSHPYYAPTMHALKRLETQRSEKFALATQSLYEMYVVYTRPISANGFGYAPAQALDFVESAAELFEILPEHPGVYAIWESLMRKFAIVGRRAHDARLVAAMQLYGIQSLVTFDRTDFATFEHIECINPLDIVDDVRS